MLKIGQNWGKIANYPPQCSKKIGTTGYLAFTRNAQLCKRWATQVTWKSWGYIFFNVLPAACMYLAASDKSKQKLFLVTSKNYKQSSIFWQILCAVGDFGSTLQAIRYVLSGSSSNPTRTFKYLMPDISLSSITKNIFCSWIKFFTRSISLSPISAALRRHADSDDKVFPISLNNCSNSLFCNFFRGISADTKALVTDSVKPWGPNCMKD